MERAFGADFTGVRVHTGPEADALNNSMSARACTTGQDIFPETAEYNPGTPEGQRLLAYELTHMVQQGGADVQRVGGFGDHPLRVLSPSLKSNKRAGMPGHNMDYTWRVDAGPDPKGPVDRLSLSGSMSEWWEEIENPHDFETDSPEEVAEKKEAGEGSKHKSWSDIHLFTPGSPTFGPWNSKINQATSGSFTGGKEFTAVYDRPAMLAKENRPTR